MKRMEKLAAALLSLVLSVSTLSACSSTGNGGGEKPVEETASKQTEAVTETTEETTKESTEETTEATETEPEKDIIKAFFDSQWAELVRSSPAELVSYNEYKARCSIFPTDITLGEYELKELKFRNPYNISIDPTCEGDETYSISFYIFDNSGSVACCYEYDGEIDYVTMFFIPLWYNETKGCFVGWTEENGEFALVELYYNPVFGDMSAYPISDMSIYGF